MGPERTRPLVPTAAARLLLALTALAGTASGAGAQEPSWMRGLEALLAATVTSVSKREQRLEDTSAAVYVLTRDDIRRSGYRSVPDLLRLVPGLQVAQIDGNKWAVSSRGLGARFAKHLLVLIDGRSIYTPYYAGVFWDAVDVPVDLIDRIEVIRGPGASIWGANAVNGVINIITTTDIVRRETTVEAGAGSTQFGTVVHSGRGGDTLSYRLYASGIDRPALTTAEGLSAGDEWRNRAAGGSFAVTIGGRDTIEGSARGYTSRASSLSGRVTDLVPYTFDEAPMRTAAAPELALSAHNLTGETHPEFTGWTSGVARPSRLRRSALGTVRWRF